jgi:sterol desaturase/sphingolipid hydroxylase (fatty acid hydroxylase superfamily)
LFSEWLVDFLSETVVALSIWGLAVMFPFRRMAANQEFRWDLIAVAAVSVFALVAANGLFLLFSILVDTVDQWFELIENWSTGSLVVAYVLFADCFAYWGHRWLHSRLMWHSHAFHHSPRHLYVLSGARASFVHILVLFAGPSFGLVLFPIYEVPAVFFLVSWSQVLNQHIIHSNLKVPFARQLEYVFVTPRFHFVHHSSDRSLADNNFGFLLSVWDRLFGTYVDPPTVSDQQALGLSYANSNLRLLVGLPPAK